MHMQYGGESDTQAVLATDARGNHWCRRLVSSPGVRGAATDANSDDEEDCGRHRVGADINSTEFSRRRSDSSVASAARQDGGAVSANAEVQAAGRATGKSDAGGAVGSAQVELALRTHGHRLQRAELKASKGSPESSPPPEPVWYV